MLRNSNVLKKSRLVTKTNTLESGGSYPQGEASGAFDLHDIQFRRKLNIWPRTWEVVSVTPSTSTVTEGSTVTFTVITAHIPANTTLAYQVVTVSGTDMTNADFIGSNVAGTFTIFNNNASIAFTLASSDGTENNVFKLQIKRDISGGADVLGESSNVTVTDAIGIDIRSNLYEISNRLITITTNDYSGNYDVGEVQQSYNGTAKVYLALKCTASTTFFNDICIAAVQVLTDSGTIKQTWNFSSTASGWITRGGRINSTSALLNTVTTPQAFSQLGGWQTIFNGSNLNAVTLASSTGSNNTGMTDGILNSTTTAYPVGNNQVSQQSGTNYLFGEVSGASRYSYVICANGTPDVNFTQGDRIRVVHTVTGPSGYAHNLNDSLWIGIY